jgi:hypothetical protein
MYLVTQKTDSLTTLEAKRASIFSGEYNRYTTYKLIGIICSGAYSGGIKFQALREYKLLDNKNFT